MTRFPAGTSFKALEHFSQIITSKKFQMFDYGDENNIKIYGQHSPKEIDLRSIKDMKIALVVGE